MNYNSLTYFYPIFLYANQSIFASQISFYTFKKLQMVIGELKFNDFKESNFNQEIKYEMPLLINNGETK